MMYNKLGQVDKKFGQKIALVLMFLVVFSSFTIASDDCGVMCQIIDFFSYREDALVGQAEELPPTDHLSSILEGSSDIIQLDAYRRKLVQQGNDEQAQFDFVMGGRTEIQKQQIARIIKDFGRDHGGDRPAYEYFQISVKYIDEFSKFERSLNTNQRRDANTFISGYQTDNGGERPSLSKIQRSVGISSSEVYSPAEYESILQYKGGSVLLGTDSPSSFWDADVTDEDVDNALSLFYSDENYNPPDDLFPPLATLEELEEGIADEEFDLGDDGGDSSSEDREREPVPEIEESDLQLEPINIEDLPAEAPDLRGTFDFKTREDGEYEGRLVKKFEHDGKTYFVYDVFNQKTGSSSSDNQLDLEMSYMVFDSEGNYVRDILESSVKLSEEANLGSFIDAASDASRNIHFAADVSGQLNNPLSYPPTTDTDYLNFEDSAGDEYIAQLYNQNKGQERDALIKKYRSSTTSFEEGIAIQIALEREHGFVFRLSEEQLDRLPRRVYDDDNKEWIRRYDGKYYSDSDGVRTVAVYSKGSGILTPEYVLEESSWKPAEILPSADSRIPAGDKEDSSDAQSENSQGFLGAIGGWISGLLGSSDEEGESDSEDEDETEVKPEEPEQEKDEQRRPIVGGTANKPSSDYSVAKLDKGKLPVNSGIDLGNANVPPGAQFILESKEGNNQGMFAYKFDETTGNIQYKEFRDGEFTGKWTNSRHNAAQFIQNVRSGGENVNLVGVRNAPTSFDQLRTTWRLQSGRSAADIFTLENGAKFGPNYYAFSTSEGIIYKKNCDTECQNLDPGERLNLEENPGREDAVKRANARRQGAEIERDEEEDSEEEDSEETSTSTFELEREQYSPDSIIRSFQKGEITRLRASQLLEARAKINQDNAKETRLKSQVPDPRSGDWNAPPTGSTMVYTEGDKEYTITFDKGHWTYMGDNGKPVDVTNKLNNDNTQDFVNKDKDNHAESLETRTKIDQDLSDAYFYQYSWIEDIDPRFNEDGKKIDGKAWDDADVFAYDLLLKGRYVGDVAGGLASLAQRLGSYRHLSNLIIPKSVMGKWMDFANNDFLQRWGNLPNFATRKWCDYDDKKRADTPGQAYSFFVTSSGSYQFVGSLQAEMSTNNVPLLCEPNEDDELVCDNDLYCNEENQICYEDKNFQTETDGYLYKITWGVSAPQDEKQTPYVDENGISIKFNLRLKDSTGSYKWLYSVNGKKDATVFELKNGARDGAAIVRFSNQKYTEACIVFDDKYRVKDGEGKVVRDICTTFKSIIQDSVKYDYTSPTASTTTSSEEVQLEI